MQCHFPLIDMNRQCHINALNEEICLEDHVHPNAEGYRRISRVLIREIRRQWRKQISPAGPGTGEDGGRSGTTGA